MDVAAVGLGGTVTLFVSNEPRLGSCLLVIEKASLKSPDALLSKAATLLLLAIATATRVREGEGEGV